MNSKDKDKKKISIHGIQLAKKDTRAGVFSVVWIFSKNTVSRRTAETLDYDIECPHCHDQLRLCGMAVDAMTHGLYRCKRCDDEAERRR